MHNVVVNAVRLFFLYRGGKVFVPTRNSTGKIPFEVWFGLGWVGMDKVKTGRTNKGEWLATGIYFNNCVGE